MKQRIAEMAKAVLLVQGALAIVFGLAAMTWPGITTLVLAYLFAVFLLVDGMVLLLLGLSLPTPRSSTRVWWGLLQLLLGLYVLYNPDVTFAVLIALLGLTLIVRGAFNLLHAMLWKHETTGERLIQVVLGLLGIIVGTVVVLQPAAGGLAFVWLLGLYAIVTGSVLVALSLGIGVTSRQRTHRHKKR